MLASEVMTENPACCAKEASLQDAAKLMKDCDCGEIPVLDEQNRPIGVITDRDICCRAVAEGADPRQMKVSEVMSTPAYTVALDASIEECCQLMDGRQIRRIPVVDDSGAYCGIVSQADLARTLGEPEIGHILRDISQPSQRPEVNP